MRFIWKSALKNGPKLPTWRRRSHRKRSPSGTFAWNFPGRRTKKKKNTWRREEFWSARRWCCCDVWNVRVFWDGWTTPPEIISLFFGGQGCAMRVNVWVVCYTSDLKRSLKWYVHFIHLFFAMLAGPWIHRNPCFWVACSCSPVKRSTHYRWPSTFGFSLVHESAGSLVVPYLEDHPTSK